METLSTIAGSIKLGETGFGWIIDQNGMVIAHPDKDAILNLNVLNSNKEGYKGLEALGDKMLNSETSDGIYTNKDGVKMVTFSARVPNRAGG